MYGKYCIGFPKTLMVKELVSFNNTCFELTFITFKEIIATHVL